MNRNIIIICIIVALNLCTTQAIFCEVDPDVYNPPPDKPVKKKIKPAPEKEEAPVITIYKPDDGIITYHKYIFIEGMVKNTRKLFIQGTRIDFGRDGSFSTQLNFDFYGYHYVKIEAQGDKGKKALRFLRVSCRKPEKKPEITVTYPPVGTKTGEHFISIMGLVKNIDRLLINDFPVELSQKEGELWFESSPTLIDGVNKFTLHGFSPEKEEIVQDILIEKLADYEPGQEMKIRVYFPPDGFKTMADSMMTKGKVLNLKKLFINEEETPLDDKGVFAREIKLQLGRNLIEITGIDTNGIPVTLKRTVIKVPKDLEMEDALNTDPLPKLGSIDYIKEEQDELASDITYYTQKALTNILGPGRAIAETNITLDNNYVNKVIDNEFDGDVVPFIKAVNINISLDQRLINKKEELVKKYTDKVLEEKFPQLHDARKYVRINYELLTQEDITPPKLEGKSLYQDTYYAIYAKKQQLEYKIQTFFQNYLVDKYGSGNTIASFELVIDEGKVLKEKDALIGAHPQEYTNHINVNIMVDKSLKEQEIEISRAIQVNMLNFGTFNLKIKFTEEDL